VYRLRVFFVMTFLQMVVELNIWSGLAGQGQAAAKAFLRSARSVTQVEPEQVTTDGHTSYPKAISEELGKDVRTSQYKNNVMEQDHRDLKGRYLRGFKVFGSADRFC
jgi:transposase-like protein